MSIETSHEKMPTIFIGHGNPMHAISDNPYTQMLQRWGRELPVPKAILCISAHWLTEGTWVTHMEKPKTIHDFYGFPDELFAVQYPAPGSPKIAELVQKTVKVPNIISDDAQWGLDHGTWSVLRHLYPKADIPVVQLSINAHMPGSFHFELGQKLRPLREQGVMIIGSGNIVHNLRKSDMHNPDAKAFWAIEFDEWVKKRLIIRDFYSLANEYSKSEVGQLSVPTPDHYFPFLYILGASQANDELKFTYEGIEHAGISMRCLSFS